MGERPPPWRLRAPRHPVSVRLRVAVAAVCTVVLLAGLIVAWQRPGFAQVPPEPVDGSVWVMNDSRLLVGRVNTGIGQLDSATALRGISQVVQDPAGHPADPVFVVDQDRHELQGLDTATVTLGARVALPDGPVIAYRSGTLAVADRADGRLWVASATDPSSVDAESAQPVSTLGAGPVLAVSTDGVVFATRPGATEIVAIDPGGEPSSTSLVDGPLSLGNPGTGNPGSGRSGDIQITAVGGTGVVLDRADSALRVQGRRFPLPQMPDAQLQESGPAADEVLISSADGLLAVNLADGTVRTVAAATGSPVAPVVVGDCRYAAWADAVRSSITGLAACRDRPAEPGGQLGGCRALGRAGRQPDHRREADDHRRVAPAASGLHRGVAG